MVDGFGLCSPGRLPPDCRRLRQNTAARELCERLHGMLKDFVLSTVPALKSLAFKLALGRLKESPFPERAMDKLRESWAEAVGLETGCLERESGQPFFSQSVSEVACYYGGSRLGDHLPRQ